MSLNGNRIGGQYQSPLTKTDKIILRTVGIAIIGLLSTLVYIFYRILI